MNGDPTPAQMRDEMRKAQPLPSPEPETGEAPPDLFTLLKRVLVGQEGRRQGSLYDILGGLPVGVPIVATIGEGGQLAKLVKRVADFTKQGIGARSTYIPKAKDIAELLGITIEEARNPSVVRMAVRELIKRVHPDKLREYPELADSSVNVGHALDLVERYLSGAGKMSVADALDALGVKYARTYHGRLTESAAAVRGKGKLHIDDPEVQLRRLYDLYGPNSQGVAGGSEMRGITSFEKQLSFGIKALTKILEEQGGSLSPELEDWAKMVAQPEGRHLADINKSFRELYERRTQRTGEVSKATKAYLSEGEKRLDPYTQVKPPPDGE